MYRRQKRNSFHILFRLAVLGAISGIAFLLIDNFWPAAPVPTTDTVTEIATIPPSPTESQPGISATPQSTTELISPRDTVSGATLFIPAAGIYAPIIPAYLDGQSWNVNDLGMNVGHLQGTAWMDLSPGNIVLSAHVELRDGRQGVFAPLKELSAGDIIILRRANEERRYVIVEIGNVEPTDLTPLYPTTTDRLTLITCDDYDFFRDTYATRTVVVADRLS
jgi:LPXTG-site transpeptidase (sortase) family protein